MSFHSHKKSRLPTTFISTIRLISTAGKVRALAAVDGTKLHMHRLKPQHMSINAGVWKEIRILVIFSSRLRLKMKFSRWVIRTKAPRPLQMSGCYTVRRRFAPQAP